MTEENGIWEKYRPVLIIGLLVFFLASIVLFFFVEKDRYSLAVEVLASLTGLIAAVMIFLKSREESDKQQKDLRKHREDLHQSQIDAIMQGNTVLIETLMRLENQNKVFLESLLNELKNSKKDDDGFKANYRLYKIKKIDSALINLNNQLKDAKFKLKRIKGFHVLRLESVRNQQIKDQKEIIASINRQIGLLRNQRQDLENRED